jgi:hypothetical protein
MSLFPDVPLVGDVVIKNGILRSSIGYPTQRMAQRAAKEYLGSKCREGQSFVTVEIETGKWVWINAHIRDLRHGFDW